MTQQLRPDADISQSNWTFVGAAAYWAAVDDDPDDSDADTTYVTTSTASSSHVEVGLQDPAGAPVIDADHQLRVRARYTGSQCFAKFELRQGAVVIAFITVRLFSSYTTSTYTLSAAEVAAITDYNDLRVRVVPTSVPAASSIRVTAVDLHVPDAAVGDASVARVTRAGAIAIAKTVTRRSTRLGVVAVAKTPTTARATRVGVQVVATSSKDGRRSTRMGVQVVAANPLTTTRRATRVGVVVIGKNPLKLPRLTRVGAVVVASNPVKESRRSTRLGAVVVGKTTAGQTLRVTRLGAIAVTRKTAIQKISNLSPSSIELPALWCDWSAPVVVETGYSTAIRRSALSGNETRTQILQRPARSMSARLLGLRRDTAAKVLATQARMATQRFRVPLFCDAIPIVKLSPNFIQCDISNCRFHLGGLIALIERGANGVPAQQWFSTITKISTIGIFTADNPPGFANALCRLAPAIECELNLEALGSFVAGATEQADLVFSEVSGPSALPPTIIGLPPGYQVHEGLPILDLRHDWGAALNVELTRLGEVIPSGRGGIVATRGDKPLFRHDLAVTCLSRDSIWKALQFFDSRAGRAHAFWFVVPDNLLVSQSDVLFGGASTIDLIALGSADDVERYWTHIAVLDANGKWHIRTITNVELLAGGTSLWRITVSAPWPNPSIAVKRVTFAHLVRFDSDAVQESRQTDSVALMRFPLMDLHSNVSIEVSSPAQTQSTNDPAAIADLRAWWRSTSGVWNINAVGPLGNQWASANPYPVPSYAVRRITDVRYNTNGVEVLPRPLLSANAGTAYASLVKFASADVVNGKQVLSALGSQYLIDMGGVSPIGSQGWTVFFVVIPPWDDVLLLRNGSGLELLRIGSTRVESHATAGDSNPNYWATWPAQPNPGQAVAVAVVQKPVAPLAVYVGGQLFASSPLMVPGVPVGQLVDGLLSFAMKYGPASAVEPPLVDSGLGTVSFFGSLMIYSRGLSNAELNILGAHHKGAFATPWSPLP